MEQQDDVIDAYTTPTSKVHFIVVLPLFRRYHSCHVSLPIPPTHFSIAHLCCLSHFCFSLNYLADLEFFGCLLAGTFVGSNEISGGGPVYLGKGDLEVESPTKTFSCFQLAINDDL